MPPWLTGALRAGLQAVWAWLVASAAARGMELPTAVPPLLEALASAGVMAVVVGAVQWAERRSDGTVVGRLLRRLARVAMLGMRPAAYPKLPA